MGYGSLQACVRDLERNGQLVRLTEPVSADQEAAEIQRRVYAAGGPAILFSNVSGCRFPMVSNLFGTMERARFIFRDALRGVELLVRSKKDPLALMKDPLGIPAAVRTLFSMRCARRWNGPVLRNQTTLSELPQLKSWPQDGGAFVTLPAVYSEHPDRPGYINSNLGMYRVQISGNDYAADKEVGLHYQIHRSIGLHHAAAIERGEALRVNIFIGGPPSLPFSAVMPLPDGIPELAFAGAMSRRALRVTRVNGGPLICTDADFCITGTIDPDRLRPEGPFGDHLGYYSLTHDFPVVNVEAVYHRSDAIWPFTVVGRPPQEDTVFGELIHELTGPAIPAVLPGIHGVHAVDAAGVHPLLLAVGSERYVPYAEERRPQELLTLANAVLGQGQLSLAKYLLIVAREDNPGLDIHDIEAFFRHVLERIDWTRDQHFQTRTTIDTLDYSGTSLNEGSKVVWAAAGAVKRTLPTIIPGDLSLPSGFSHPEICFPGVLAVRSPPWRPDKGTDSAAQRFSEFYSEADSICQFPLIILCDDSEFCARTLSNFLWITFTRSNPASDTYGIAAFTENKHWGCRGALIIDARIKSHHAPPLEPDPEVVRRVDRLFAKGGPLHGVESS